jgi:hypothetical protein
MKDLSKWDIALSYQHGFPMEVPVDAYSQSYLGQCTIPQSQTIPAGATEFTVQEGSSIVPPQGYYKMFFVTQGSTNRPSVSLEVLSYTRDTTVTPVTITLKLATPTPYALTYTDPFLYTVSHISAATSNIIDCAFVSTPMTSDSYDYPIGTTSLTLLFPSKDIATGDIILFGDTYTKVTAVSDTQIQFEPTLVQVYASEFMRLRKMLFQTPKTLVNSSDGNEVYNGSWTFYENPSIKMTFTRTRTPVIRNTRFGKPSLYYDDPVYTNVVMPPIPDPAVPYQSHPDWNAFNSLPEPANNEVIISFTLGSDAVKQQFWNGSSYVEAYAIPDISTVYGQMKSPGELPDATGLEIYINGTLQGSIAGAQVISAQTGSSDNTRQYYNMHQVRTNIGLGYTTTLHTILRIAYHGVQNGYRYFRGIHLSDSSKTMNVEGFKVGSDIAGSYSGFDHTNFHPTFIKWLAANAMPFRILPSTAIYTDSIFEANVFVNSQSKTVAAFCPNLTALAYGLMLQHTPATGACEVYDEGKALIAAIPDSNQQYNFQYFGHNSGLKLYPMNWLNKTVYPNTNVPTQSFGSNGGWDCPCFVSYLYPDPNLAKCLAMFSNRFFSGAYFDTDVEFDCSSSDDVFDRHNYDFPNFQCRNLSLPNITTLITANLRGQRVNGVIDMPALTKIKALNTSLTGLRIEGARPFRFPSLTTVTADIDCGGCNGIYAPLLNNCRPWRLFAGQYDFSSLDAVPLPIRDLARATTDGSICLLKVKNKAILPYISAAASEPGAEV